MAATHREPNRARWVGVRPGHDGVTEGGFAWANNGEANIRTVPVGKTLLVTLLWVELTATAVGTGGVLLYNAVPAAILWLLNMKLPAAGQIAISLPYNPPFEVQSGFSLRAVSSVVGIETFAGYSGILISN